MPSLVTHYLGGELALSQNNSTLKPQIIDYYQTFIHGTSGPDLFFYYNAYPWMNQRAAKAVAHMGSVIHKRYINDCFKIILENTKDMDNPKLNAYVAGLLTHWALDAGLHPFIFYFSTSKHKRLSSGYHRRYEHMIDALMLKQIKHVSVAEFKPQRIAIYDEDIVDIIMEVYGDPLDRIYNINLDREVARRSLNHFYRIEKQLNEPSVYQKTLYDLIEKINGKPYSIRGSIIPDEVVDEYDVLNLEREGWAHPVSGEKHDETFNELFIKAAQVASEAIDMLADYLEEKITIDEFLNFINNRSYETGLSKEMPMKFFECKYD